MFLVRTVLYNYFCFAGCPKKLKNMMFWYMYCAIAVAPTKCLSCEQGLKKPKYINCGMASVCSCSGRPSAPPSPPRRNREKSNQSCFNSQKSCDKNRKNSSYSLLTREIIPMVTNTVLLVIEGTFPGNIFYITGKILSVGGKNFLWQREYLLWQDEQIVSQEEFFPPKNEYFLSQEI